MRKQIVHDPEFAEDVCHLREAIEKDPDGRNRQIIFAEHTDSELYTIMYNAAHSGTFTVYVRGRRCGTEADFFREISAAMQFPYYFGENWAAFDECITDLEWLDFSSLLIVIDHFQSVFAKEGRREILMKHLNNACAYWTEKYVPITVIANVNPGSDFDRL